MINEYNYEVLSREELERNFKLMKDNNIEVRETIILHNIISNIFIPTPPSILIIRIYKNKSVVGVILFSLNLEYDKPVFVIILSYK